MSDKKPERKDYLHPDLDNTVKQPEYTEALEEHIESLEKQLEECSTANYDFQDEHRELKAELQKLSKATRENTKHFSDEEVIAMYGKEIAEIIWTN